MSPPQALPVQENTFGVVQCAYSGFVSYRKLACTWNKTTPLPLPALVLSRDLSAYNVIAKSRGQLHAVYIITEYAQGGDLLKLLLRKDTPLGWRFRIQIAKEVPTDLRVVRPTAVANALYLLPLPDKVWKNSELRAVTVCDRNDSVNQIQYHSISIRNTVYYCPMCRPAALQTRGFRRFTRFIKYYERNFL